MTAKKDSFRCMLVSWSQIEKWASDVSIKILGKYEPEVIVGLTRGGWVPARILSDHLLIKQLYSVKTEHWGLTATPTGSAVLAQPLTTDISGKKVLIVDDITDTGQSLSLALEHIRSKSPADVKTATFLHIEHSSITPDFYSEFVAKDRWTWFIFPWNYREDLLTLIPKTFEPGETLSSKEICSNLEKQFQISPPLEDIEMIAEFAVRKGRLVIKDSNKYSLP